VTEAQKRDEAEADELRAQILKRTGLTRETLTCPRERSDMTPCIARDGGMAVAYVRLPAGEERAVCVGCETSLQRLLENERSRQEGQP
jgi:hypothetical protein